MKVFKKKVFNESYLHYRNLSLCYIFVDTNNNVFLNVNETYIKYILYI